METLFPDSCLPFSLQQLERTASPYFKLVKSSNGRVEYVYAIEDWCRRLRRLNSRKLWIYLKMGRRLTAGRTFLYQLESARYAYNAECFRREVMDHERMFFEKV
jgi:cyclopropane-fatty-acyl-phospholipid synthase